MGISVVSGETVGPFIQAKIRPRRTRVNSRDVAKHLKLRGGRGGGGCRRILPEI
jgi:hypothetical protein